MSFNTYLIDRAIANYQYRVLSNLKSLLIRLTSHQNKQKIRDSSTQTYHIFCSYGGSGSSFLTKKLDAFMRPDVWQPAFNGKALIEWKAVTDVPDHQELLDIRGYDAVDVNWEPFNRRTKNRFKKFIDPKKSIKENLIQFCHWIKKTE